LTLKRYKFNWSNPTAHWSLNLDDKTQRAIMMQIIAINNFESEFSKNHSGRGDTSQQVSVCLGENERRLWYDVEFRGNIVVFCTNCG
jgi:hypothetical protein